MKKFTLSFDVQQLFLIVISLAVGVLIGWWQPWSTDSDQTVSVVGEATLKATPDEFVFNPSYQATAATSAEALEEVRQIGDTVVEKLKSLNVNESAIKSDINSFPYYFRPDGNETDQHTANYSLTVTVSDKDLAQEILDYLLTTENKGSSTPQSIFSDAKQKELKVEARRQAIENARLQGEQIASELGGRLDKVMTVEEVIGFDLVRPLYTMEGRAVSDTVIPEKTQLLIGEQDLNFSVKVVFSLR